MKISSILWLTALVVCMASLSVVSVANAELQRQGVDCPDISIYSIVMHTPSSTEKIIPSPYIGGVSSGIYVVGGNAEFKSTLIQDIMQQGVSIGSPRAKLFAFGPELTSADSNEISVKLECTSDGVKVTANISRSGNIDPSLRSNDPWRPIIEAYLTTKQPVTAVEVHWVLRATEGGSERDWIDKKTINFAPN